MTTLTSTSTGPARALPTAASTSAVRFHRLVLIELRKLVDTRAGVALLGISVALAALLLGAVLFLHGEPGAPLLSAFDAMDAGTAGLRLLLPVIAILLATSEWAHRGAMTTFILEPRRLRVVGAKILAVTGASLALFAVTAALSLGMAAAFAGAARTSIVWTADPAAVAWLAGTSVLSGLMGLALGMLLMNTAAAISAYFVLPLLLQALRMLGERVAEVIAWIDTSTAFAPLTNPLLGEVHWGKVAVSAAVWVVAPLVAGGFRLVHREVK